MTPAPPQTFDAFSPKRLLLQAKSLSRYVRSKWLLILPVALLCGAGAAAYAFFKKPLYVAETTFALDEGVTQRTPGSNLSEFSRELGLNPGLEAGGIFSSMANIVELLQSRLLLEKTLRSDVVIDGRSLRFADFFLDSLQFREKWMKESPYPAYSFRTEPKTKDETLFANGIMNRMKEKLVKEIIAIDMKGKGTSILSVTCTTTNELFSKYFLEALVQNVVQYYIDIKTQRSKMNLAYIQKRTDSIRNAYNSALYGRAAFSDAHMNPNMQVAVVSGEKRQTDVQILKTAYVELTQNLESAKTALMKDTPLIQVLDTPILPLKVERSSLLKWGLVFFVVGLFAAVAYFVIRRVFQLVSA